MLLIDKEICVYIYLVSFGLKSENSHLMSRPLDAAETGLALYHSDLVQDQSFEKPLRKGCMDAKRSQSEKEYFKIFGFKPNLWVLVCEHLEGH